MGQALENKPSWAEFDLDWYRQRYQSAVKQIAGDVPDEDLEAFWRDRGAAYGHSPNRYFAEVYYRRNNHSVGGGIQRGIFTSGFQHYEEIGFQECAPHWLFSETGYFLHNPDLSMRLIKNAGLVNGYDHYLRYGHLEQRVSTPFFDPDVLRTSLFQAKMGYFSPRGEYFRVLEDPEAAALRCSWYFDPDWYLKTYPEIKELIATGQWTSALHHYLSNDDPSQRNPNPYFDDAWYRATYHDVAAEVALGKLRNGYEHFLKFGIYEGRKPREDIELRPQTICTMRDNAFITFVRARGEQTSLADAPPLSEAAMRKLTARRRAVLYTQLTRSPLDFTSDRPARLTVIIPVQNDFPALVDTLNALHGARHLPLQIIIVDMSGHRFLARSDHFVCGIQIIRESVSNPQYLRDKVFAQVQAPYILFVKPGLVLLDPGFLDHYESLAEKSGAMALAPMIVDAFGNVMEAGVYFWRDAGTIAYGAGLDVFSPVLDYRRACDSVGGSVYICKTDVIRNAPPVSARLAAPHQMASLSLTSHKAAGKGRIEYLPGFVVQDLNQAAVAQWLSEPDRQEALKQFGDLCAQRPFSAPSATRLVASSGSPGDGILVITRKIPHGKSVGTEVRLLDTVNDLAALGLSVTLISLSERQGDGMVRPPDIDHRIELCWVDKDRGLSALIKERARCFDYIWVDGSQAAQDLGSHFAVAQDGSPLDGFIYDARGDAEAQGARRIPEHDTRDGWSQDVPDLQDQMAALARSAWMFQCVLLPCDTATNDLVKAGFDRGISFPIRWNRPGKLDFANRSDILFALPVIEHDDIGHRALLWTLREVMPRLEERLGYSVQLKVNATPRSSAILTSARHYASLAPPLECYRPLETLCDMSRIMFDPTDATYALTAEAEYALSRGLPVVASGEGNEKGVVYTSSAPDLVVEALATLYENAEAWRVYSEIAQEAVPDKASRLEHLRNMLASTKAQKGVV